jgi:hypothetical protein
MWLLSDRFGGHAAEDRPLRRPHPQLPALSAGAPFGFSGDEGRATQAGLSARTSPVWGSYGFGVRVPLWVISPHARKGPVVSARPADHTSTLKLIERLHSLPTLTSRNHSFDSTTPTGPNYDTGGTPAPPRDGVAAISDLYDLFTFS